MSNNLSELRALLHATPEVAWSEVETQKILKMAVQERVGSDDRFIIMTPYKTALLIAYKNGGNQPFHLFRADMDALPVSEDVGNFLQSENSGKMHACGHDLHMTILFGLIDKVADEGVEGNLLFLFQPAEEGGGGAKAMIDAGVFDDYTIASTFALHVTDDYPIGTVASNDSIFMAVPKEIDLVFSGKSSHAAMPHRGNDAIAAAADALSSIHLQLARSMDPVQLFLFHSGKIEGGTARNIVADSCTLSSTARALSSVTLEKGMQVIENAVQASAAKFGCHGVVKAKGEYIETVNTPHLYELFADAAADVDMIAKKVFPTMTGEDFGYFTRKYSGLMFWLGTAEEGRTVAPLHAANYCPSSNVIPYGVNILFAVAEHIIHSQD